MAREDTKNRDNAISCIDALLSKIESLEEEIESFSRRLEKRDKEIAQLKEFFLAA